MREGAEREKRDGDLVGEGWCQKRSDADRVDCREERWRVTRERAEEREKEGKTARNQRTCAQNFQGRKTSSQRSRLIKKKPWSFQCPPRGGGSALQALGLLTRENLARGIGPRYMSSPSFVQTPPPGKKERVGKQGRGGQRRASFQRNTKESHPNRLPVPQDRKGQPWARRDRAMSQLGTRRVRSMALEGGKKKVRFGGQPKMCFVREGWCAVLSSFLHASIAQYGRAPILLSSLTTAIGYWPSTETTAWPHLL
jgi:hypothetical protein